VNKTVNKTNIGRLFNLADAAKDVSQYGIANVVFAVLVREALRGNLHLDWEVEVETEYDYERGEYNPRLFKAKDGGYWDLFVVKGNATKWYLNIPLPIVREEAFPTLYQPAHERLVERGEHGRRGRLPYKNEIAELWNQLQELIPQRDIDWARSALDMEADDDQVVLYRGRVPEEPPHNQPLAVLAALKTA